MPRTLPQPGVESINLTSVLSALADPVRRAMIGAIWSGDEATDCRTIAERVDVSPATLSHHWRVIREAGLTTTYVKGRNRIIEVRRADLEERFPGLLTAVLDADQS